MEATKPSIPTRKNYFQISLGKDNANVSISCCNNSLKFILAHKNKNGICLKFEKSFTFEELNKISKWFKIFDSLEEVYEDIIKLMENKQVNINLEENIAKLVFNINMEKIKEFDIVLEKKELTKDELINNLINENKELKIKVNNLEKRINSLEERFNAFEKKSQTEKKSENNENNENKTNEILKSDIIDDEDKKTLNNWINLNNNKTIKLLYKASRDGDSYQDFYRLCEDKGPTITIALTTKGYKFGGFTSLSWNNPNNGKDNNKYYEDKNAFIFSLNKKRKYYPKIGDNRHVWMWSDRGPSFGGGNDMTLHNNCLHNNNSYNNSFTYQIEKCELNGGEYNFTVKDYEVYSIN